MLTIFNNGDLKAIPILEFESCTIKGYVPNFLLLQRPTQNSTSSSKVGSVAGQNPAHPGHPPIDSSRPRLPHNTTDPFQPARVLLLRRVGLSTTASARHYCGPELARQLDSSRALPPHHYRRCWSRLPARARPRARGGSR